MSRQAVSDALSMIKGVEKVGKQTAKLGADTLEKVVEGSLLQAPLKQARGEIEAVLTAVEASRPDVELRLEEAVASTLDSAAASATQVQSIADAAMSQAVSQANATVSAAAASAQSAGQEAVTQFNTHGVAGLANVATSQAAAIFDSFQRLNQKSASSGSSSNPAADEGESEADAILRAEMAKFEEEMAQNSTQASDSMESFVETPTEASTDSDDLLAREMAQFQAEALKAAEQMGGVGSGSASEPQKREFSTWSGNSDFLLMPFWARPLTASRSLGPWRRSIFTAQKNRLFCSATQAPSPSGLLAAVNQLNLAAAKLDFSAAKWEKFAGIDTSDTKNNLSKTPIKPPKASDLKLRKNRPKLSEVSRENRVPSGRVERLASYTGLAAGLAVGGIAEMTKRAVGITPKKTEAESSLFDSSIILNAANAERIVNTLCKVRGAALKLGQMLSIADNSLISAELQEIFNRVRQGADFMPWDQTAAQLTTNLGFDWRDKVENFEEKPFAAASIGQVHLAELEDGTAVAVKIQYPGIAEGIDSDINNLVTIMNATRLVPETLFLDEMVRVARKEMAWEVNYDREKQSYRHFRQLLEGDPVFYVPAVIDELSSKRVLTTEFLEGIPLDAVADFEDQTTRNLVGESILRLTLTELFDWRCMQTDPNWANFMFCPTRNKIGLLDFGASRFFTTKFVDSYVRIINSAATGDREGILYWSKEVGFLSGYEAKPLIDAHVDAIMILGEAFQHDTAFDFGNQTTVTRITNIIPAILTHRLTAPPEEVYSLHRKMAGVFLLCTKLKCNMNIKHLWTEIWSTYEFGRADLPEALAQEASGDVLSVSGRK